MKVPDPIEQPTVSVDEAARCLGIGRNAAYDAAKSGVLPTIKVGRRLRVPTAALRRMLQIDCPPAA